MGLNLLINADNLRILIHYIPLFIAGMRMLKTLDEKFWETSFTVLLPSDATKADPSSNDRSMTNKTSTRKLRKLETPIVLYGSTPIRSYKGRPVFQ